MKGTELMLGDWVMHDGKPKKVDVIWSAKQVSLYDPSKDWGSIYTDKHSTDEIEPIPLTTDILNKNFPDLRYGIAWYWDDEKSTDSNEVYEIRTYDLDDIELNTSICYVHELQHILNLCGIEKEIVL